MRQAHLRGLPTHMPAGPRESPQGDLVRSLPRIQRLSQNLRRRDACATGHIENRGISQWGGRLARRLREFETLSFSLRRPRTGRDDAGTCRPPTGPRAVPPPPDAIAPRLPATGSAADTGTPAASPAATATP